MENSEAENWADARAGDSGAFAAVFDAHRDRVFGQALRLVREPNEAEDVTGIVFFEAWRRRGAVRVVDGSIIGWLLVTTNNVVRNLARSKRRYRALLNRLPLPSPHDGGPDPSEVVQERLDQEQRDAIVRAAFDRLSLADQHVLTLCVLEELTQSQAARVLGVPEGTVKSRLSRAKKKLSTHAVEAFGPTAQIFGGSK